MTLALHIGNKNYSSWSMRPWVLLRQAGIEFDEVMVRFDSFDSSSGFKQSIGKVSPAGKVPALVDDGFVVFKGSLAREEVAPSAQKTLIGIRQQLTEAGIVTADGESLRFVEDYLFDTPSGASSFVLGRSSNGWTEWKNESGARLSDLKRTGI